MKRTLKVLGIPLITYETEPGPLEVHISNRGGQFELSLPEADEEYDEEYEEDSGFGFRSPR